MAVRVCVCACAYMNIRSMRANTHTYVHMYTCTFVQVNKAAHWRANGHSANGCGTKVEVQREKMNAILMLLLMRIFQIRFSTFLLFLLLRRVYSSTAA